MTIYRKYRVPGGMLAIYVAFCLYSPFISAGEINGTEWEVTRGDTLYAIGRAIFPGDARKQARLRQDIMRLNPAVFAGGANNMKVGVILRLPEYVAAQRIPSKVDASRPTRPAKVAPKPEIPADSVKELSSLEWKVASGDTLYRICRTIFPGDGQKQAQLGRDIKKLNPSIFAEGADKMKAGVILKLPNYVTPENIPYQESVPATVPLVRTGEPETPQQDVAPVSAVEAQPDIAVAKEEPVSPSQRSGSDVVVSLGFSSGGEKLVDVADGPDIYSGTGAHMRLGYEQMLEGGSSYRISLGFQYYTLLEQKEVSFRDTYLQLAYQYRLSPFIYGIGGVLDTGAKLTSNAGSEFETAIGGVVYMEYVGSGYLNGWGLGLTSLGIKEKDSGESFDASRIEFYYNWKF